MTPNRPLAPWALALSFAAGTAAALPIAPPSYPEAPPGGLLRVFDERIDETLDLPTWELQQARRRMLAGETISWDSMRALADLGDGLAAYRLAQRIEAGGDPADLSDAAFYYATAAYTNRDYAVGPLVRILERGDVAFGARRLDHLENALRAMALAGDAKAKEALSGFYASGEPFGLQPERALEFRLDLAETGDGDAAMALVLEAMSGASTAPLDDAQVERLLAVAADSEDLGLRTTAENLRRMIEATQPPLRPVARAADAETAAPDTSAEEATP